MSHSTATGNGEGSQPRASAEHDEASTSPRASFQSQDSLRPTVSALAGHFSGDGDSSEESVDDEKSLRHRDSVEPVNPSTQRQSFWSGMSLNLELALGSGDTTQVDDSDLTEHETQSEHGAEHEVENGTDHGTLNGTEHEAEHAAEAGHNGLTDLVAEIDERDATSRYREEAAEHKISFDQHRTSSSSLRFEETIISWEDGDPQNPYNWPPRRKTSILLTTMMLIINSTMGSALPSNAIPLITAEWGITSPQQKVLPISVYLIGYVMGPILWAPLSEQYGRRNNTIATFGMFTLFTLACALAPTWSSFLVFRFFTGVFASAPIAIVPGIFADIYGNPRTRGRSMGLFLATTLWGPLFAPIISGYCSTTIGWRWAFWIGLIYAAATMVPLAFLPETYGPVLLLRRAKAIRKHDPTARVVAPHELEKKTVTELATVVLTRPIRMIIFEPIVSTSCAYLALCYAIFYMTFQAFPIIFQGLYRLSPGECGLTYLAIGAGCLLALPVFLAWDTFMANARARDAPWTRQEEYRRLPLACIGGPLFVVSLFWLGWTSRRDVPFLVPMLAGIPFGMGFMCIFQALLNYLTDAYEIFAASANAASSTSRSLFATVLPLATSVMFARLGVAGACSLLGGLALLMCAIPFVFLWQGEKIRASSKFCLALRVRKEEMAKKIEEQRKRLGSARESAEGSSSSSGAASEHVEVEQKPQEDV
ncbi:fluconazole resistance protein [Podospora appendiculata]|uniref:Fluconazole resistance protein n=1 Tax=Podospora appendiculata TaxID=314037 RepID=A0AAE1C9E4_9PEZI|nr:fluconazole resistance protein [Podospora appendiculata]